MPKVLDGTKLDFSTGGASTRGTIGTPMGNGQATSSGK